MSNLFEDFAKATKPVVDAPVKDTPVVETKVEETKVETKEEVKNVEVKTEDIRQTEEKVEPFTIKSAFGDTVIGETKVDDKVETPEQFFSRISKDTGTEIKAFDDVFRIINEKVPKTQYEQAVAEKMEYEQFLSTLPDDISAVMLEYYKKGDYKSVMKSLTSGTDYTKPVSDYDEDTLIKMYNADMDEEDITDMDEKPKKALYRAAKAQYEAQHKALKAKQEDFSKIKLEGGKKLIQSIDKSIDMLKKKLPNLQEDKINKVREKMMKGYTLADENGYYEDAATRIALAEHGHDIFQEIIDQTVKMNQRKIEQEKSKTKEELLKEKYNDDLKKSSAVEPPKNAAEEIGKSLPFLGKKI